MDPDAMILQQQAQQAAVHRLGCSCCRVVFETSETQRDHYRTDWHRHNLKRKVAGFGPITLEVFSSRLASLEPERKPESSTYSCTVCSKSFNSEKSFDTHVKSKKHRDVVAAAPENATFKVVQPRAKPMQVDSSSSASSSSSSLPEMPAQASSSADPEGDMVMSEEEAAKREKIADSLTMRECIFCSHEADDFQSSLNHMIDQHSLWIPSLEYVTDMEGMIRYLLTKVHAGFACLCCPRVFSTSEAAQCHMQDTGHCRVPISDDSTDELSDFYNMDEMFEEIDDEDPSGSHLNALGEIVLPDGRIVGNRKFRIYYKQKPLHEMSEKRAEIQARMQVSYAMRGAGIVAVTSPDAKSTGLVTIYNHEEAVAFQKRLARLWIRKDYMDSQRSMRRWLKIQDRASNHEHHISSTGY